MKSVVKSIMRQHNGNGKDQPEADNENDARFEAGLDAETDERTTRARGTLYELIARFRKDAASTDDQEAQSVFEFAAEIVAGLSRALRQFQERRMSGEQPDRDADS